MLSYYFYRALLFGSFMNAEVHLAIEAFTDDLLKLIEVINAFSFNYNAGSV